MQTVEQVLAAAAAAAEETPKGDRWNQAAIKRKEAAAAERIRDCLFFVRVSCCWGVFAGVGGLLLSFHARPVARREALAFAAVSPPQAALLIGCINESSTRKTR